MHDENVSLKVDLRPPHVLGACAIVALVAAFISDAHFAWILIATGLAFGAWRAHKREVSWPAHVQESLQSRGYTSNRDVTVSGTPAAAVYSFEPMSLPQIFATTIRVVFRHFISLVGVPFAVLMAVFVLFFAAYKIAMATLFDAHTEVVGSVAVSTAETGGSVWTLLGAMFAAGLAVAVLVAFPADAFLLSVTVLATYRAVVGQPVLTGEIMRESRRRIRTVCTMTGTFYAISLVPDLVVVGLLLLAPSILFSPGYLVFSWLMFAVMFVLGLGLSFAPFVMMVEKRGVVASLRRSMALTRPALGRLLLIHVAWVAVCMPLWSITVMFGVSWVLLGLVLCIQWAFFRTLQMMVYVDLRTRHEGYGDQLRDEWHRNVQPTA